MVNLSINDISNALLLADTTEGLQRVKNNVVEAGNDIKAMIYLKIKLNCKRTKIVTVNNTPLERLEYIHYATCNISATW